MGQGAEGSGITEVKTKLVVVGDCGCGKTALIKRYVNNTFSNTYTATGFDTYNTTYQVSGTYKIQMSIWDTSGFFLGGSGIKKYQRLGIVETSHMPIEVHVNAGDSGYDRVRPVSYSGADLVLICFSIGNPDSLYNIVSKWLPEVKEHCPNAPIMIIGCGTDLRTDEAVLERLKRRNQTPISYDQGLKTAKEIEALVYSETSAKTSEKSVKDVVEVAALSSVGTKQSEGQFRRQRSFIKRKRFSGMGEAKTTLRKEATKSCAIM